MRLLRHSLRTVKQIFLPSLLILSNFAFALETDNYLSWRRELQDSGEEINRYFNREVREVLAGQSKSQQDCEETVDQIGEHFRSRLVHDNPVENYLLETLSDAEVYPTSLFHVPESIYRNPFRVYIPFFGLAPNIQVRGFYFGTDKLSHFASTGKTYYDIHRKSGSLEKAIAWGIRDEKSVHGYWASGVFSYADLEANYQGYRFYRSFCHGPRPLLGRANGAWGLRRSIRIEDYVSGLWDETYLENHRLQGNWEKIRVVLKEEYCELAQSPRVKNRFRHYEMHPSHSNTLKILKRFKTPVAQSFQGLCSR